MIQIILLLLILLLPVSSEAAYKIYLKNGSLISGVDTYTKTTGGITVYLGSGSFDISEEDILKIEGIESSRDITQPKELPKTEEKKEDTSTTDKAPAGDTNEKANALISEYDSLKSELKTLEEQESKLVETINEKQGARVRLPASQRRTLDSELAQLKKDLSDVQSKKQDVLKRGSDVVNEIKELQAPQR
jgi:chromosome segregation ATPase